MQTRIKQYLIICKYYISIYLYRYSSYIFARSIKILSPGKTVDYIIEKKCSVCRFGDGEFYVMGGMANGFQKQDSVLAKKLRSTIASTDTNLLVCIPLSLKKFNFLRLESKDFALGFFLNSFDSLVKPYLDKNIIYGDSLFTRFYMMRKRKTGLKKYITNLREIWNKRNLLIVEGKGTRLGVGNDLFENATSIRRILCPNRNAFDYYSQIIVAITKNVNANDLILISLGITATVLACDLSKSGQQAIDIGHIDIEYEWMKAGATEKIPISNKQMAEIKGGQEISECSDVSYLSQIICQIG